MSTSFIDLDGSEGEGGGQILRSSLALSLLTGKPFRLHNVRARRARPGLQPQHRMSVRASARVGNARVIGDSHGSSELQFEPGEINHGTFHFPIGTAGATALVLHTIYLPLALRTQQPSDVLIEGGTHNEAAPCFHFLDTTWRRYLEAIGMSIDLKMLRPGFYPRGGGAIEARIQPCSRLNGIHLVERSRVTEITGISAAASLPESVAARQARQASARLRKTGLLVNIREEAWSGGPGTMLALTLNTAPAPTMFFGLGARGKRAEQVADEAVDALLAYLAADPAAIDPHSADQLVLPLAFAQGASEFTVSEVTSHLLTNLLVIRRFVEREIICEGEEGQPGTVRIG